MAHRTALFVAQTVAVAAIGSDPDPPTAIGPDHDAIARIEPAGHGNRLAVGRDARAPSSVTVKGAVLIVVRPAQATWMFAQKKVIAGRQSRMTVPSPAGSDRA